MPVDMTVPNLTSLRFQSPINLSGGAQPITFTVGATDDSAGIEKVYIWFATPISYSNGPFTESSTLFGVYDALDSYSDGQSSSSVTITSFNAPGTYTIDHVDVFDKANNKHTYNTVQLSALGAQTSFTIASGVADDYPASSATTGVVSVGGSIAGNIESTGDLDWIRVSLTAGRLYQFDLEATASGQGTLPNPFLELFNSTGSSIVYDFDS